MTLRELDARVVPRAAAGLRALLDGAAERRAAARRRLRDVPPLGLLLAGLLLLAGAGAALSQREGGTSGTTTVAGGASVPALGPPVGAGAETHLAQSAERLVELAARDPAARHLALVSLRRALTPGQTGALLDRPGLVLERAYLRADVPGRPEEVLFQTPGDVVAGLQQVFGLTAMRKTEEQRDLLTTAARTGAQGEPDLRTRYEQDAATAGAEAEAYRAGCACVFALVVDADLASLRALLDLPEVRGVEAAPGGAAVGALSVRPLRPSETGTVGQDAP